MKKPSQSVAMKKAWNDPEVRDRYIAAKCTAAGRKKNSESVRLAWRRREVRKRMLAARRLRVESLETRLWKRVIKLPGLDSCWEWQGKKNKNGYGMIKLPGGKKEARVHRVSWQIHYGGFGDLNVLHKCDNPRCVRPDHLFLGTQAENIADMVAKGRNGHPASKRRCVVRLANAAENL